MRDDKQMETEGKATHSITIEKKNSEDQLDLDTERVLTHLY